MKVTQIAKRIYKYLWRAGKKNSELEYLKKARWYIDKMINEIENE